MVHRTPVRTRLRHAPGPNRQAALAATRANADFWERMTILGAQAAAKWQSDKTAVELIEEQRR